MAGCPFEEALVARDLTAVAETVWLRCFPLEAPLAYVVQVSIRPEHVMVSSMRWSAKGDVYRDGRYFAYTDGWLPSALCAVDELLDRGKVLSA